jgi:hypothetical protein
VVDKIKKEIIRVWLGNLFLNLYESLVRMDQAFLCSVITFFPFSTLPIYFKKKKEKKKVITLVEVSKEVKFF